jgi:hypothetical protein
MTAWSLNLCPSLLWAARDAERITEGISAALSAGVTGENSPLYTNQPKKRKTDRVLPIFFFQYSFPG